MKKHTIRISIPMALVGMLLVLTLFWLGGFDFNERGSTAVSCAAVTLLVGILFGLAEWFFLMLNDI